MKGKTLILTFFILTSIFIIIGCSNSEVNKDNTDLSEENYPSKTITIYTPFSAGGVVDLSTRALAEGLEEELGVNFNIVERSGSGGIIAMKEISGQEPDGYTLSAAQSFSQKYFEEVGYDVDDFTYISTTAYAQLPLVVRSDSEWDTIDDFIEYGKNNPGEIRWGSGSTMDEGVLSVMEFLKSAGIEAEHVPYEGGNDVLQAILSGDIQAGITADYKSPYEAGEIKLLAEASGKGNPDFPDVKTFTELGYAEGGPLMYYGIVGPKGIPEEKVNILEEAMEKVVQSDEFKERMENMGIRADYLNSEEYETVKQEEDERLGKAVDRILEE